MDKRKCVFTNEDSNFSFKFNNLKDKHNWAKTVPCTKMWWNNRLDDEGNQPPLTDIEFKLVELFFKRELAILQVENIEKQMEETRKMLKKPPVFINKQNIKIEKAEEFDVDLEPKPEVVENKQEEKCPSCETTIQNAPGIGDFCPNKDCLVGDDIDLVKEKNMEQEQPKEEVVEVKVTKKIIKKPSLWG